MSDLSKMTDEELSMHIKNIERFVGAPSIEPWGIPRPRGDLDARLERLRAEQVRRTGIVVERPVRPVLPRVRADAVKMGGLAVDRAKVALEEALFVLAQGQINTAPLQDALGIVRDVHAELADLGAPIESAWDKRPRDGKDPYGRKVRYLSHKEHDLLVLASAENGCLVLEHPASHARAALIREGLVSCFGQGDEGDPRGEKDPIPAGKMRCLITPKGRRAMETWHYEVETG